MWKLEMQQFDPLVLSCSGVDFGYDSHKLLFKNVDFGIDMESRSKFAALTLTAV